MSIHRRCQCRSANSAAVPFILSLLVITGAKLARAADDLTVLPAKTDEGPTNQMLTRWLKARATEAFAERQKRYDAIKSPEDIAAYQSRMKQFFLEQLGELPERTPLNAKVVGTIDAEGMRVEKLIYESQPRHYVTANLYLPTKTAPPWPAVLVPCGHSRDGKVSQQRICALLASIGIAAMSYDPIGQGERYQFIDDAGKPRFGSTTEHTLLAAGSIPIGRGTATHRIWDGMRSIDYLCGRTDIDASRIGVTGCSGGGTLTSYLMALDDRVQVAAPSCYLTSLERLIATIGPQDGEQNIHSQIAFGLDHADYIAIRAPRPTLMLTSTRDFFDITGSWNSFREAKRLYTRLGAPQRVELIETDATHGYPKPQREAMATWMRRWLLRVDEPVVEPEDLPKFSEEQLRCSPKGQVMLMDGARSVVDLNVEWAANHEKSRPVAWAELSADAKRAAVRAAANIRALGELPVMKEERVGTIEREGYAIDKLALRSDAGLVTPALLFHPAKPTSDRVLYLHGDGKQADAAAGGPIEKLVREGHPVLAIDLRGAGEVGRGADGTWGADWNDIFLSYLLGRSLVGMRAEDAIMAARWLRDRESVGGPKRVIVIATGQTGPPALHAAAVEPRLFDDVRVTDALESWRDVLRHADKSGQLSQVVHGALRQYDLPDLRALYESK